MMESETTAKVEIATLNGGFFLSYAMMIFLTVDNALR